jgi:DNA polymerase III epsilon subunit-like protein
MKLLFLDLETTGLNAELAQIVEVAIIDETGRCLLSTRYKPSNLGLQTELEIQKALDYNKLSLEELNLYPELDRESLHLLCKILTSADQVIGHNISFDASFLSETSKRVLGYDLFANIKYVCTMALLAKSKGIKSGRVKLPNMRLDSIAHSALSDAQGTRLLYQSLSPSENQSPEWNL